MSSGLTGVMTRRNVLYMNSTVSQNRSHRNDIVWTKTTGRQFIVNGEAYTSEYLNVFTGQAIRKDWRMTRRDWIIFNAAGEITGRSHSLTWAKMDAANA